MNVWARTILAIAILAVGLTTDAVGQHDIQFFDGSTTSTNYSTSPPNNPTRLTNLGAGTAIYTGVLSGTGGVLKFGSGTIVLTNASTYTGATIVRFGTLEISGSVSHSENPLGVGGLAGDNGTVRIVSGGSATNSFGSIADVADTTGAIIVTGTGSRWTNNETLTVGRGGAGTLTVQSGGVVSAARGRVGEMAGSIGEVTVSGVDSKWTNAGDLYIGNGGTGTLTVQSAAGVTSSGNSFIGAQSGSTGTVSITGAGSSWVNAAGGVFVGNAGNGALNIQSGGTVSNTFAAIGENSSGEGEVTVDGTGAQWTNSGDLRVGARGTGRLAIQSGGTVSNTLARIGEHGGSSGLATVAGVGSRWTNSGDLYIGNGGVGTLTIQNGGVVTSVGSSRIGDMSSGNGTVSLSGAGSSWENTGDIVIGNSGQGTLSLSSGATVSATTVLIGSNSNSVGSLTLSGTTDSRSVLRAAQIVKGSGTSTITFSGGVLRATADQGDFLSGSQTVEVASGGAFLDTNGYNIGISAPFAGPGGLVKMGAGILTLSGSSNLGGTSEINGGRLVISAGGKLSSRGIGIGRQAGTTGEIVISGAGAILEAIDFATIGDGPGSTGTLTVADGGLLRLPVGGKLTVGWQNATGTLNVAQGGIIEVGGADGLQKHATGTTHFNLSGGTIKVVHSNLSTSLPMTLSSGSSKIDTNDFSANFSGEVSGSGALIKTGAGLLTLSGANSYAGGTTVSGGAIEFSSADSFGSGKVTLSGGVLRWAAGNTVDISSGLNAIGSAGATFDTNGNNVSLATAIASSSGSLSKTGAGTLTLGSATLGGAGALNVNGGALVLSGATSARGMHIGQNGFTGAVTVTGSTLSTTGGSNGFITVGDNDGSSPNGGTGTLTIGPGGIVALGIDAKLTVGWLGATGTLNLETGGTLQVGSANGIQKHASGTANFNFAGGTLQVTNRNLTTALDIALSGATSTIDTNGRTATLSGVLSGSGALTKSGAGTLTLSGANTYTGATSVSAGTLEVSGSLAGSVTVQAGATLEGTGSIGGPATILGTLIPGKGTGLITFEDDLTLDIGSVTSIELGSISLFDQVFVDGILTYDGKLTISLIGGYTPRIGDKFQLFKAFDSQSGSFTQIAFSDPAYAGDFNYADGTLQFTAIPEPSTGTLAVAVLLGTLFLARPRRARSDPAS